MILGPQSALAEESGTNIGGREGKGIDAMHLKLAKVAVGRC